MTAAARLVGVSPQLIARRVSCGQLRTMTEPRDLRVRLVDLDDLRDLFGAEAIPEDMAM